MKTRPSQKNRIILIRNGHQFIQTNIKLIDIAKKFILLHTYIFLDDEVTKPILDALIRASQRGVRVFILIDAFGSFEFSDEMIKKLEENRIQFSYFTPLFKLHKLGRRLHQKSLIINNRLCLTGGINLSKEFNDKDKPWLDYSCCIEGEEVHHIYQHTIHFYLEHFPENKAELLSFNEYKHFAKDSTLIKTNTNDFLKYNQSIYNSYLKAIHSEFNPYPDKKTHSIQIWIVPNQKSVKPRYDHHDYEQPKNGTVKLLSSFDGDGIAKIHQDMNLYLGDYDEGGNYSIKLDPKFGYWLQVTKGSFLNDENEIKAGDGMIIEDETELSINSPEGLEFLLFELS